MSASGWKLQLGWRQQRQPASWHVQLKVFNTPISNQAMICWYLYAVCSDFVWLFVIYTDLLWLPMISRYLSQAFFVDSTSHFLVCLGTGCTWSVPGKGDGQEKEDVHLACFFFYTTLGLVSKSNLYRFKGEFPWLFRLCPPSSCMSVSLCIPYAKSPKHRVKQDHY